MSRAKPKPIAVLDYPWVAMEAPRHPMHVGGLIILQAPEHAPPDFVANWVESMRGHRTASPPFNRRLARRGLGRAWPRWETVDEIELDYHLRHSALPWPGGERELGMLVSRLHRTQLDLSEPLWELHVIEGLHDDRFAIYMKVHHSLMDGVAAIRTLRWALTADPERRDMRPMWAYDREPQITPMPGHLQPRRPREVVRDAGAAVSAVGRGGRRKPYTAPKSVLNGPITPQRRVSTQSFELNRMRLVAKAMDGTLNDVLVAICAGGLRRYLLDIDALPDESLVASMPVSVRGEDVPAPSDKANAISFMFAAMGTDLDDPRERVAVIKDSVAQAKAHLNGIPAEAVDLYTSLTMGRFIASQVTGLGAVGKPMFNVLISNVPGPREKLYYNGAEVLGLYPLSVLQSGQILNITALSYDTTLNLAITACPSGLPHIQRLALYCADAFDELADAYDVRSTPTAASA
ncbi:MAG: diacylglycerol O-acyltransferase / wax synthase [Pseudonocardiales bacterium]|nr:diacylglycerol O-acyltransferase / wax synthase [Pseudonocardiales bacterium]